MTRAKFHRACVPAVLAVVLASPACLSADTVNSNSSVGYYTPDVGDIPVELYIQTDKAVYELGEPAELLFRVSNLGDRRIVFSFSELTLYRIDIWVRPKGSIRNLWSAGPDEYVSHAPDSMGLDGGQSIELSLTWDKADYSGAMLPVGAYDVKGVLGGWRLHKLDGTVLEGSIQDVSVGITIIPEPISIITVACGSVLLLRSARAKRSPGERR